MRHRVAELIGALSLATERSAGFPREAALRTSLLATRLARVTSASAEVRRDACYAGALRFSGCTGFAVEEAALNGGDDIAFVAAFSDVELADPLAMVRRSLRELGRGHGVGGRARAILRFLTDPSGGKKVSVAHCRTAHRLSARLGMSPGVLRALDQMYERYDGRGEPGRLGGDALSEPARLLHVAHIADVFLRLGGVSAACEELKRRSGRHFPAPLVKQFIADAPALCSGLDAPSLWDTWLAEEPSPHLTLDDSELEHATTAFAWFSDLKSTFTLGHSTSVATLARACAPALQLDPRTLGIAALVHDVGRAALSNALWDKPGPFSPTERALAAEHSAVTEQVLSRCALLSPFAEIAGAAHERLDGSGYHRRAQHVAVSAEARLLQACDVWTALREERAHRAALGLGAATQLMADEVTAGRLDRRAVEVVLAHVGQRAPSMKRELPHGLSARELEVLQWLARGLSNKEIGAKLFISARTVQTHVMHLFEKTGIHGRAAAALYAVEHGLTEIQHSGG